MNYYLSGQVAGNILSIVGIGSFICGLIFSKQRYLLLGICFFSIIELIAKVIIKDRIVDMEMQIAVIVVAAFIAGYVPYILKMYFKNKKKNN